MRPSLVALCLFTGGCRGGSTVLIMMGIALAIVYSLGTAISQARHTCPYCGKSGVTSTFDVKEGAVTSKCDHCGKELYP